MRSRSPFLGENNGNARTLSLKQVNLKQEIIIPSICSRIILFEEFHDVWETSEHPLEGLNFIRIQPDLPQPLDWFRTQIDSLRGLIVFLAGLPMENKWIQGALENQTSNSSVVNVVHRHSPVLRTGTERQIVGSFQTNAASVRTLEMDRLSNYGMTFPLEHLVSEPQCIQNAFITWFDRIEKLSVPFTLCLDVIYNEHSFHEFEFLALIQSLESYYQQIHTDIKKPELRKLLSDLYNGLLPSLQVYIALDDDFLTNIIHTRNYYSHHNPRKYEKALKGDDLYDAIRRLVAFVVAVLSKELEIPEDKINNAFERTEIPGLWSRPQ